MWKHFHYLNAAGNNNISYSKSHSLTGQFLYNLQKYSERQVQEGWKVEVLSSNWDTNTILHSFQLPPSLNLPTFCSASTYSRTSLSIMSTFSGSLYRDRRSTNSGGTPLCRPCLRYLSTNNLNSFPANTNHNFLQDTTIKNSYL